MKLLGVLGGAVLAAAVFAAYLQPGLLVAFSSLILLCG